MKRGFWALVLVAAAAGALAIQWSLVEDQPAPAWPTTWRPRLVRGVVLKNGEPVSGARVTGYSRQDTADAPAVEAVSDAKGAFELPWREFLVARLGQLGAYVRSAPGSVPLNLRESALTDGIVVDIEGRAVPNVTVAIGFRDSAIMRKTTANEDGRFVVDGVLSGHPLDILVAGPGLLPRVERRFVGGETITLRVFPGEPVRVVARDPFGSSLPDATTSIHRPDSLQGIDPVVACEPAGRLVWVRAPGHLPVRIDVAPHRTSQVILWPEREVTLVVLDSVRKGGVPRLDLEVEIRPGRGSWHAGIAGSALRRFLAQPMPSGGAYRVRLPACPLTLQLSAPGFSDASVHLDAGTRARNIWMRPLPRALGGTLDLRGPPDLPVLVTNADRSWVRVVSADGRLEVPADSIIGVASFGARAGVWFPRRDLKPLRRGERRTVTLHTLPAIRFGIDVTPAERGLLEVTPKAYESMNRPQRVRLIDGRAEAWVRPGSELRVDLSFDGNYFPVSFEITAEREDFSWPVRLRPAAGVSYRIRDGRGNPVAFARARLWEPGRSGRLELRSPPKVVFAGADGVVHYTGLRGGEAALELAARGFRTRLFSLLQLTEGELRDPDPVVLAPAGRLLGRVTDYRGKPVAGAWMRVLEPAVVRLPMPGGGERDLYDLVHNDTGTAATGADGRFEVPDAAARAPLIACFATARPDLTPATFRPDENLRLTGVARIELDAPGSVSGVYLLVGAGQAVLIAIDPPMSLRPLPVSVPAGKVSLFVRLRDRRWAAVELNLQRGEMRKLSPRWQR